MPYNFANGGQSQAAGIFAAFTGVTYQPNSMDVQHEPLYDTLTVAAGSAVTSASQAQWFFANPSGKTINLTNVQKPQQLPAPEAFAIFGISIKVNENILLADFLALQGNLDLSFIIGQKSYNRGPLWYYTAGGGISGYFTTGGTSVLQNGVAAISASNPREINIVIDNQASFYAQLEGATITLTAGASGGTGMAMVCLLDGLHARGVQ